MELILLIEGVMLTLLAVMALYAALTRSLLSSVLFLCVFSLIMAVAYLWMGAPDVAMTEAAVGAGASTLILLAGLKLLGEEDKAHDRPWLALLVVVPFFALLCLTLPEMPAYASAATPAHQHVAAYYIEKTQHEIAIPNIVTAILASYRGFDTLGEVTVILTAGLAVFLLLGRTKSK